MEKYSVDTTAGGDFTKTASKQDRCKVCNGELEKHGRVLKCVNCGTAPYEKADGKED